NAGKRLTVLRAIDKLDRFGIEGVRLLLGEGRKDESGDFTKGAGLNSTQIEKVIVFAQLQSGQFTELQHVGDSQFVESNKGVIDGLMGHFGSQQTSRDGISELKQIAELVEAAGYGRDRIRIDPSVVRGLEYYT